MSKGFANTVASLVIVTLLLLMYVASAETPEPVVIEEPDIRQEKLNRIIYLANMIQIDSHRTFYMRNHIVESAKEISDLAEELGRDR